MFSGKGNRTAYNINIMKTNFDEIKQIIFRGKNIAMSPKLASNSNLPASVSQEAKISGYLNSQFIKRIER